MKTRIIAGLCMLPLLLVLYLGGITLAIACAVISYIGVTEFYNGWEALEVQPSKKIAYFMITVLYAVHFMIFYLIPGTFATRVMELMPWIIMAWITLSITVSLVYGWRIKERGAYDAMATALGLIYVVFFSYHLVLLDMTPTGYMFTWTVILAAFGSDICAYFTGFLIGKTKLAPNLSPKKTVEGAIGGIIGAGILCGIYGYFFIPFAVGQSIIIGIIGGAVSQAGDLSASAFKRKMGIKDYGNLIPGHGGIMDRFDSVIFTAPFVYYFVIFFFEK
ncbi:MAG: phosphatidate cytidylyltransferase [Clostridiales bacterium]|nr:phosphatidate cytidylyltransferase [Clostridiales bacterium]